MITGSEIYWITRLDSLKGILEAVGVILCIVGGIGFIMSTIIYFLAKSDDEKEIMQGCGSAIRWAILVISISFVFSLAWAFTPTTKEMCVIKVIPVIANNKGVQELPNKVVELANEWMEELKPKKEKKN